MKPLNSKEGYYLRFTMYVGEGFNHAKAWEKTQSDYEEAYGIPETKGFGSLESFKSHLSRWLKGK